MMFLVQRSNENFAKPHGIPPSPVPPTAHHQSLPGASPDQLG